MTWKQIETSREIRLWVGQIIVPTVTTVTGLMMIPEVRGLVKAKANELKERIEAKKKEVGS